MRKPVAIISAATAIWLAVACLDISSPAGNILAISSVLLPSPSVVVGDDLRDTTGDVAKLQVVAFGAHGDTIRDAVVRFFAIDDKQSLHVDSITGVAWADDSLSAGAKVVARVTPANGSGILQTTQVALPVVPKPDSATRGNDTTFLFSVLSNGTAVTDSFAVSLLSPPLSVTVHGENNTVVPSYLVSYEIVDRPESNGSGPTVVLFDRSGNDSTVAITDVSGVASRQLRVRPSALKDTRLITGAATDTVVVQVRVRYHGNDLPISANGTFIITIRGNP